MLSSSARSLSGTSLRAFARDGTRADRASCSSSFVALALDGVARRWRAACSWSCPWPRPRPPGLRSSARADDAGDTLDGGGGFDGGAAKFHDDHQSSIPSEYISSAFSTAAPAAPRTVLWPQATNL